MNVLNHDKVPFRDMTPGERSAIVEAWCNNGVEFFNGSWKEQQSGSIYQSNIYRTKPRQLIIPWDVVSPEYKWSAMDKNTKVWFYTEKPIADVNAWVGGGNYCKSALNINTSGIDWRESLVQRPEGV